MKRWASLFLVVVVSMALIGVSWADVGRLLGMTRQAARQRFAPMLAVWLPLYLPAAIVAHVVFSDHQIAALLVLWWLKPVFDRAALAIEAGAPEADYRKTIAAIIDGAIAGAVGVVAVAVVAAPPAASEVVERNERLHATAPQGEMLREGAQVTPGQTGHYLLAR